MGPVTVRELETAPLDTARTAADIISRAAEQLTDSATIARESAQWREAGIWTGAAADAASHSLDGGINRWDATGFIAGFAGHVAAGHVRALIPVQAAARAAASAARRASLYVLPDGVVSPGNLQHIPGIGWAAQGLASALTGVLVGALKLAELLDNLAGSAVNSLQGVVDPARPSTELRTPTLQAARAVPLRVEDTANVPIADSPGLIGHVTTAGDLRSAEEIVTFVTGVGSDSPNSQRVMGLWAQQQVAAAKAEGRSVAVVVWNGYDAPDSLAHALSPAAATRAAPELQRFQSRLRQQHPGARLSVVGYSYGSVVVGQSAHRSGPGLDADNVTFLGSPGVRSDAAEHLALRTQLEASHTLPGQAPSAASENPQPHAPVPPSFDQRSPQPPAPQPSTPQTSSPVPRVRSTHAPGDLIQLATEPWIGIHGPDPSSPAFAHGTPATPASAESWSRYAWQRVLDAYLLRRGETDAHSSYLWDPAIDIVGPPTSPVAGLNNSGTR